MLHESFKGAGQKHDTKHENQEHKHDFVLLGVVYTCHAKVEQVHALAFHFMLWLLFDFDDYALHIQI